MVHTPLQPTALVLQEVIEKEVQQMLNLGVKEESVSPWRRPPTILAPMLDGSVRFCINFQQLNAVSAFDAYSMPEWMLWSIK